MTLETPTTLQYQNDERKHSKTVFFALHQPMEQSKLRVARIKITPTFKARLISLVSRVKGKIFDIHDPSGVRRLTQLRVGLSLLREHRFRHNFLYTTDPMCLANDAIETATHFMLLCHEYDIHRTVLLDRVTSICASHGVNCNLLNDSEVLTLSLWQ